MSGRPPPISPFPRVPPTRHWQQRGLERRPGPGRGRPLPLKRDRHMLFRIRRENYSWGG